MATLYKYLAQGGREVTFLDADDQYKADDIRQHWASTFPELTNATSSTEDKAQTVTHEGQEVEVQQVVTFAKRVGTKGAELAMLMFRVRGLVQFEPEEIEPVEVNETTRALNGEMAEEQVIVAVMRQRMGACDACWASRPRVTVVLEDEVMRLIGAPMLPGFERG